jgi:hypothetical protein
LGVGCDTGINFPSSSTTSADSSGSSSQDSEPTAVVTDTTAPAAPTMTSRAAKRTLSSRIKLAWGQPEQGVTSFDVRYRSQPRDADFGDYVEILSATAQTSATVEAETAPPTASLRARPRGREHLRVVVGAMHDRPARRPRPPRGIPVGEELRERLLSRNLHENEVARRVARGSQRPRPRRPSWSSGVRVAGRWRCYSTELASRRWD